MRCLAAIAAGLALSASSAAAGSPEQAEWLEVHRAEIAVEADQPPVLPDLLVDARLLLLGEVHGLAHGQAVDLALFKALHRQAGVRHYLGEFDAAQADAFNRYLDTGERAGLDAVFAQWRARGVQWANAEFRAKIDAIADWNATLPVDQRIRFVGVDDVQDSRAFCLWLDRRIGPGEHPKEMLLLLRALRDPAKCEDAGGLAPAALATGQVNDPVTRDGLAALAVRASLEDREARIAANALRQLSSSEARFYGLWGLAHVVKAEVNGTVPMALALARAGISVRSIAMLNLDGAMMLPILLPDGTIGYQTALYTVDNADAALVNGIEPFARAAQAPMTLFNLTGVGSPFCGSDALSRVGGRFGEMQRFEINPATAAHCHWADAVLVSRGSPATTPLP